MISVRYRRGRGVSIAAQLRRAPSYVGGTAVESSSKPVGIREAARLLSCSPTTLRRWIKAGAPVLTAGKPGRGGACLVDPAAIDAWRHARGPDIRRFADHLPSLVADAVYRAFVKSALPARNHDGISNHPTAIPGYLKAGLLADVWLVTSLTVLDALRDLDPTVPRLRGTPEQIRAPRKIASS